MLIFVLGLTGCSSSKRDIPKLLTPVANNQSFRPVGYGRIGKSTIKIANVVPESYCHFFRTAATISELKVDLGEYVKEGTVLASVDVSKYQMEIDKRNAEITYNEKVKTNKLLMYGQQKKEQLSKKKQAQENGDTKAVKNCETQLKVIEENIRYDEMLCSHQVKMLNEEIKEYREYVEDGTIKARHAGYVTYIKDLSETNEVESMENIVIVSDYDTQYLELEDDISSPFYEVNMETFSRMYASVNGKEVEVKPFEYTKEQLIAVQSANAYPNIRLSLKGGNAKVQVGDKVPVYFVGGTGKEVLKIGQDSLYEDGDKYFVYVKTEDGKEKREIEIGTRDTTDVEVVKGLKEGEWVFYSSNTSIPEAYEEYPVKLQEYSSQVVDRELKYQHAYTKVYTYTQSAEATVESINVAKGDAVKKGDLIAMLDTGEGSAKVLEAANSISDLEIDYDKNKEEYDNQIDDLEKQIKQMKKKIAADKKKLEAAKEKEETTKTDVQKSNILESSLSQNEIIENENAISQGSSTVENETEKGITEESATESNTTKESLVEDSTTENTETNKGTDLDSSEKQSEQTEESTSSYELEQLEYQKNIIVYQKEILAAEYNYNKALLQIDYNEIAKNNDGSGKVKLYAQQDGVVGNLNIYEGKTVDPEKDTELFQIFDESSMKLVIDTGNDFVGVGNIVTFTYKTDKAKEYKGKVVGNSAIEGKVYLSEVNGKMYTTTCASASDRNRAYIAVDDKEFYENEEGCNVAYSSATMQNAVVLPTIMVSSEVNKKDKNEVYYFVWKVVEGTLVKQYVKVEDTLMTSTDTCILEGLKDGDVLANQKVNEK